MTDRLQDNGGAESVSHPATTDLAAVLAAIEHDDYWLTIGPAMYAPRGRLYIALARAVHRWLAEPGGRLADVEAALAGLAESEG